MTDVSNSEPDADDKIAMINGGTIRICILLGDSDWEG